MAWLVVRWLETHSRRPRAVWAFVGSAAQSVSLIGPSWREGDGTPFQSTDPATGQTVWEGHAAATREVDAAVERPGHLVVSRVEGTLLAVLVSSRLGSTPSDVR